MPLMYHRSPLRRAAAGAYGQRDPFMVKRDVGPSVTMHYGHEVPQSPEVVALAVYELARRLFAWFASFLF